MYILNRIGKERYISAITAECIMLWQSHLCWLEVDIVAAKKRSFNLLLISHVRQTANKCDHALNTAWMDIKLWQNTERRDLYNVIAVKQTKKGRDPFQLNTTAQLIPIASAQMAFLANDMFCDSRKEGNMKCHFYSEKKHF